VGNTCSVCGSDNSGTAKFCNECGQTLGTKAANKSKPVALKQGTMLRGDRYITKRLIKAGGMGAVYEATDKKSNRIFAIKELWTYVSTAKERDYLVKRFKSEANLLSKLNHMSLPKVYDYFIDNERYYLVMDFIDGCDLDNLIRREGKPGLPQEEVVKWGIQICEVLEYLHNLNPPIIYRDLKPSNIMLRDSDNRIVLIDFGIACALEDNSSGNPRTMIGTMGYIAPEQYLGKPVPASDIYSLGGTLYNLLTGSMPVPFSYKHMTSIVPEIAAGIEEIVCRSLNLKAEERYETAKEVKTVLTKVLESEILSLRTIKEKPRLSRWKLSGELPELYDILPDMCPVTPDSIITGEKIEEKDTKEMKNMQIELNEAIEVIEGKQEEEDKDKIYIDLLEELLNKKQETLVKTIQAKKKFLDERFFEIFDHTVDYVASEDANLAKELNNLNKIMASMDLRKTLKEEVNRSDSDELFDENFIEDSIHPEDDEIPVSPDIAEEQIDIIEIRDKDINEDFSEKKDELYDEDFIDFSSEKEDNFLTEKNLSIKEPEKEELFDEDFIADNMEHIKEINEEFTEENIEEIFSPAGFIQEEITEQFDRELQEEDYVIEEADPIEYNDSNLNDNPGQIQEEDYLTEEADPIEYNDSNLNDDPGQINDDYHILYENLEEGYKNTKDQLKAHMDYDMLEEEMIISDSLWETEEETIDLSFQLDDEEVIKLKEKIIELPEVLTGSKKAGLSNNISIKRDTNDYRQDNGQKYFEEAQKLIGEKNFEQAVNLCEKALDYNDKFLEVHYTLGTLYKKINRPDLAVESYKKYLALKQKKTSEKIKEKK
jgi:serine/threonine protein kinase